MEDALAYQLFGILPDADQVLRVCSRLVAAVLLGAVVGIQRELQGKPAGLRTHSLVTLSAALFVIVPLEAGMDIADVSRVIQGVSTGIGFIGAGVILKLREARDVVGLTTSATIWAATAIGIAIGLGYVVYAAAGVLLTWLVLTLFSRVDEWIEKRTGGRGSDDA
jgi:putative Mg2+ transporter-C (MgtC) family protein